MTYFCFHHHYTKFFSYHRSFQLSVNLFGFTSRKMSSVKIFSDVGNVFSLRLLASCYATGCRPNVEIVDSKNFKLHGSSVRLPIVQVKPGHYIFSHNVATSYIFDQSEKFKLSDMDKAKVDELVEWDGIKLQPPMLQFLSAHVLSAKNDAASHEALEKTFSTLNSLLEKKQYLSGTHLTAADAAIWGSLYCVMQIKDVKDSANNYPALASWFQKLCSNEAFSKAVEGVTGNKGLSVFKGSLESFNALPQIKKICQSKKEKSENEKNQLSEDNQVTPKQIEQAKDEWAKGLSDIKPRIYQHPILPVKGEKNILITSALPYVNNVPHLGNIIGCVLSADVYARYCRLRNYNCLYVSGTDEYGTATETKALAEGVTPREICDKYNHLHTNIYKWFNIDFDYFGRTSTDKQTEIAQDIFWKIYKNGYFLEDNVEQLQCTKCNKFLADRFVEGICPLCSYEDARGDQCDACGKLINAIELIKPRCKICSSTPVVKTSRHVFLDLPKISPQLESWLTKKEEDMWTHNARTITKAWVAEGLKPRCVTRDLKWGTPVPLEGFNDKVFYVWFDAPIGYISITANYTNEWEKWWKNPVDVTLVNFMAKDNVPFHTVVFPSSLIAAKDNYTLVNHLSATEYLNYEDSKFSKSRGVGVFGDHAESTGIPSDIFRFYLLFVRPETNDSAFKWSTMAATNNSELLNNLGNFINRSLMFMKNAFKSIVPDMSFTDEEYKLIASINIDLKNYVDYLEKFKIRDAVRFALNMSRAGNQYIQNNQPWVLAKGDKTQLARAGTVIAFSANISALISILIHPYMPDTSAEIQKQLNLSEDCLIIPEVFRPILKTGHQIGVPSPLFKKIDDELVETLQKRFQGGCAQNTASTETEACIVADPTKIVELESQIVAQGVVVRKAKTKKLSKDVIDVEVKKLLDLKSALTKAQGVDPSASKKGKNKPAVEPAANQATSQPSNVVIDPAKVAELETQVAAQGDIVRKVKADQLSKDVIDTEVKRLLDLKLALATAQGIDPNNAAKKGKNKKGKK